MRMCECMYVCLASGLTCCQRRAYEKNNSRYDGTYVLGRTGGDGRGEEGRKRLGMAIASRPEEGRRCKRRYHRTMRVMQMTARDTRARRMAMWWQLVMAPLGKVSDGLFGRRGEWRSRRASVTWSPAAQLPRCPDAQIGCVCVWHT